MKKIAGCSLIAATAALLSLTSPATAGILNLESGPNFTPETAFTNNTIMALTTVGEGALIRLTGGATVTPPPIDPSQATVDISGTFSASAGEVFSAAYSFSADLNTETPVDFTITGTATVNGVTIPFSATGTITPGLNEYEGTFQAPAFLVDTAGDFTASLVLDFGATGSPLGAAPGTLDLLVQQIDIKLDPIPAEVLGPALSQNISTRANVGTGDHVLIGGFIITGTDPKMVVLRAIGPSLTGISGVLADPFLELHDDTGATIASNDNWMDLSMEDQTTLTDNDLAPDDDAESALVMTLDPGQYTTVVSGANETTGVALAEAYDIDDGTTDSRLGNISTRGFVETGDNVMIGGFILGGGGGGLSTVVIRAIGPSLTDFGITDALADPVLELHDLNGVLIDSNDNWMDDPNMQLVSDAGLAPGDPNESALYKILPSGEYTAIVSGAGDTSGVALVETYNLEPQPVP